MKSIDSGSGLILKSQEGCRVLSSVELIRIVGASLDLDKGGFSSSLVIPSSHKLPVHRRLSLGRTFFGPLDPCPGIPNRLSVAPLLGWSHARPVVIWGTLAPDNVGIAYLPHISPRPTRDGEEEGSSNLGSYWKWSEISSAPLTPLNAELPLHGWRWECNEKALRNRKVRL